MPSSSSLQSVAQEGAAPMTTTPEIIISRTPGEYSCGERGGSTTDYYIDGKLVATIEQMVGTVGSMYSSKGVRTLTESYEVDFMNELDAKSDKTFEVSDYASAQSALAAAKRHALSVIS